MARPRKTATKVVDTQPVEKTTVDESAPITQHEKIIPKEIDLGMYIPVVNGFNGMLIYVSKRTGEVFNWDALGDVQDIELRELKNAKSSAKAFFENNWFMFDDEYKWVISFLGVDRFYKNAIDPQNFDDIFTMTPAEVKKVIKNLSNGQKSSVAYRARQLVMEKEIDSLKVIAALEEALGIELIEKK